MGAGYFVGGKSEGRRANFGGTIGSILPASNTKLCRMNHPHKIFINLLKSVGEPLRHLMRQCW